MKECALPTEPELASEKNKLKVVRFTDSVRIVVTSPLSSPEVGTTFTGT